MKSLSEKLDLAASPLADRDELWILARDENSKIRRLVAQNSLTSEEILTFLSYDSSPVVRIAVAENCCTPEDVIEQLAEDRNTDVRFALAGSPRVPFSILKKLADDHEPMVSERSKASMERVSSKAPSLKTGTAGPASAPQASLSWNGQD